MVTGISITVSATLTTALALTATWCGHRRPPTYTTTQPPHTSTHTRILAHTHVTHTHAHMHTRTPDSVQAQMQKAMC
eukprot:636720-Alexandrium_andersonii.AAC.1